MERGDLRLLVVREGVGCAAQELGDLGHAGEGHGGEAAAPRARGDGVRGALLGEEAPELRLVAVPGQARDDDPVVEGVAIHPQVLALDALVVAHARAWKPEGEATQDGPGVPVRLVENHLLRLRRDALATPCADGHGHAEGNLVAARQANLAAVLAPQSGLAVAERPHKLLADDGPHLVHILAVFGWGVQHDTTELSQALDVRGLRVALDAQTNLEENGVLLRDPHGRVDVGHVLAAPVGCIVGP
mmetsp:Transcript_49569/g.153010  ORF Transcript_49569/g.153010 Transcript_49569/m.153010 type:complete len:245 (-) Transcript_49569:359-1093(-)